MATITFDTHRFVRKLEEAGFDQKQAEGLTEAMRAAIEESELVTKKDFPCGTGFATPSETFKYASNL